MLILPLLSALLSAATPFHVDAEKGNSNLQAVFDAPLGERINAVSSQVGCDLTFDDKTQTASGTCSVPLTSIMVDNEPTKTEHFQQWTTNKKTEPKDCKLEAHFDKVKVSPALRDSEPSSFETQAAFTVCGRKRSDGGKETVRGTVIRMPAGSYSQDAETLRIRAKIDKFSRDAYRIGPKYTDGWFARVQSLAKVVAEEGTIELSLFAKGTSTASK